MLTPKQNKLFEYIKKYLKNNNSSPSLEEIGRHFKLAKSTIHEHIETLKDKGYLEKNKKKQRSINLPKIETIIKIPLVGTIMAGQPIEAIESKEKYISISNKGLEKNKTYYALKVQGDSMIDDGIFDGDIVVIKKQSTAENGQTVVAIIDNDQATLKKIFKEKDRFRLQPANQNLLPFYRKEIEVRGVVINIIRNFESKTNIKKFRTLDLFAGIGAIRLGFENAGFKTVFANDFDKNCKITYDLNFNDSKLIVEDIKKIGIDDLPEFDFLLAGFPCQAFSIAGYRQGFNDKKDRGNLFFNIAEILEKKRPIGFLLENVKNLKNHDNGKTFKVIIDTLKSLEYFIDYKILNSMDYGNVPQNRERIYIVGFNNEEFLKNFSWPNQIVLEKKISDILEEKVDDKYYYNNKPLFKKLKNYNFLENTIYQWRRQYVRENKKGVCPTLTANMGTGGHNVPLIKDKYGIRKLTPIECARIQGLPRSYKLPTNLPDSALYKQIGNSVTVPVVEAIAKQINIAIS